jgi:hypothetical protein
VELATDAEAVAGTSTTLAVTPANVAEALINGGLFLFTTAFTSATSGTGASTGQTASDTKQVLAPTSATGYALLRSGMALSFRGFAYNAALRFNKRLVMAFRFAPRGGSDANSIYRVTVGKLATDNAGDLTRRGFGIKGAADGVMQLQVHDGTTLTTVNSSFTIGSVGVDVEIVSDGAGNVTLFVDGSQVATTSAGPSTVGGAQNYFVQAEAENTTTLTGTRLVYEIVNIRTITAN